MFSGSLYCVSCYDASGGMIARTFAADRPQADHVAKTYAADLRVVRIVVDIALDR